MQADRGQSPTKKADLGPAFFGKKELGYVWAGRLRRQLVPPQRLHTIA
jgi:hypothetical protein